MGFKNSQIMKVAGLSFVGFCAVSFAADRVPGLAPAASQAAGFCGAFIGAVVGQARLKRRSSIPMPHSNTQTAPAPVESTVEPVLASSDSQR